VNKPTPLMCRLCVTQLSPHSKTRTTVTSLSRLPGPGRPDGGLCKPVPLPGGTADSRIMSWTGSTSVRALAFRSWICSKQLDADLGELVERRPDRGQARPHVRAEPGVVEPTMDRSCGTAMPCGSAAESTPSAMKRWPRTRPSAAPERAQQVRQRAHPELLGEMPGCPDLPLGVDAALAQGVAAAPVPLLHGAELGRPGHEHDPLVAERHQVARGPLPGALGADQQAPRVHGGRTRDFAEAGGAAVLESGGLPPPVLAIAAAGDAASLTRGAVTAESIAGWRRRCRSRCPAGCRQ